ncbi:MAG TPA: TlpA disulfide reductase family protein [Bryobacteraceae bacterium]|nr:TlpA disulfide reductase family protein [Bryobacteraceae bacterium]
MRAILLCAAILVVPLSADKNPVEAANAKSLALAGKPAPAFTLPDLEGRPFSLADRRGHTIILAFWGSWCPPCRAEMPMFARLEKELAPDGVAVIPVAFDKAEKARAFLQKNRVELWSLLDERGTVAALYGAHALPKRS